MDPRKGIPHLREFFSDVALKIGSRKERKYDKRGSSALWNDDQEFATPNAGRKFIVGN